VAGAHSLDQNVLLLDRIDIVLIVVLGIAYVLDGGVAIVIGKVKRRRRVGAAALGRLDGRGGVLLSNVARHFCLGFCLVVCAGLAAGQMLLVAGSRERFRGVLLPAKVGKVKAGYYCCWKWLQQWHCFGKLRFV